MSVEAIAEQVRLGAFGSDSPGENRTAFFERDRETGPRPFKHRRQIASNDPVADDAKPVGWVARSIRLHRTWVMHRLRAPRTPSRMP